MNEQAPFLEDRSRKRKGEVNEQAPFLEDRSRKRKGRSE